MSTQVVEPFAVMVHPFPSRTRKNCAYELGNTASPNALVFIGGLKDGPHTTPYIWTVAKRLEEAGHLGYSVFEIRIRSSFTGFGTGSLKRDVEDISSLVTYLRGKGKQKIILFGHSTGCQDCMEYTNYAKNGAEPVDGFILQAPISDRDGVENFFPEFQKSLDFAEKWIAEGKADWCMPRDLVPAMLGAPITAYRLWSLLAKDGDDDYFSHDLEEEKVKKYWGRFQKPVLVLHSEKDEFIPEYVDQVVLSKRYRDASPLVSPLSGLIPNTGHTVLEDEPREWLAAKVIEFLASLDSSSSSRI